MCKRSSPRGPRSRRRIQPNGGVFGTTKTSRCDRNMPKGPNPVRELPSQEEMVDYLGQPMYSDDAENSQRVATVRSHSDEPYSFGLTTGLLHELGPTPVREEAADEYASQVWFVTNDEAMCRHRTGGIPERPQLDTYGGEMDPSDRGSYAACALRKISEEAVLPESWWTE
eukprot:scaffold410_cov66-Phaeocystis_antarctica.AAC.1